MTRWNILTRGSADSKTPQGEEEKEKKVSARNGRKIIGKGEKIQEGGGESGGGLPQLKIDK